MPELRGGFTGKRKEARDKITTAFQFTGHEGEEGSEFSQIIRTKFPLVHDLFHETGEGQQPLNGVVDFVDATCHESSKGDHPIFLDQFPQVSRNLLDPPGDS